jgi:hypothetical protein
VFTIATSNIADHKKNGKNSLAGSYATPCYTCRPLESKEDKVNCWCLKPCSGNSCSMVIASFLFIHSRIGSGNKLNREKRGFQGQKVLYLHLMRFYIFGPGLIISGKNIA